MRLRPDKGRDINNFLNTPTGKAVFQRMDEGVIRYFYTNIAGELGWRPPTARTLPDGAVNTTYPGANLTPTPPVGTPPYTFTYVGDLPKGLRLDNASGSLSGTPKEAGRSTFTVTVTDSANKVVSRESYQIDVT